MDISPIMLNFRVQLYEISTYNWSVNASSIFLSILALLIIITGIREFAIVLKRCRKIRFSTWIILAIIILAGAYIRISISKISYDPDNMIRSSYELSALKYYNNEPYNLYSSNEQGYAFFLSRLIFLFGDNDYYTTRLISQSVNVILSIASIFIVFLLGYLLLGNELSALVAAIIMAFSSIDMFHLKILVFPATCLFLVCGATLFFVNGLQTKRSVSFLASFLFLAYANHIRTETSTYAVIFLIGFVWFILCSRSKISMIKAYLKKLILPILAFIVFYAPLFYRIFDFYVLKTACYGLGLPTPYFSVQNVIDFTPLFCSNLIDNRLNSPLVLIFAFLGVLCLFFTQKKFAAGFLTIWFVTFSLWFVSSCLYDFKIAEGYFLPAIAIACGAGVGCLAMQLIKRKHYVLKIIGIFAIVAFVFLISKDAIRERAIYSNYSGDTLGLVYEEELRNLDSNTCVVSGYSLYVSYVMYKKNITGINLDELEFRRIEELIMKNRTVVCFALQSSPEACGYPESYSPAKQGALKNYFTLVLDTKMDGLLKYRILKKNTE